MKKRICIGLLAHVDAGKTTLSESILYESGSIRKLGRVDDKDAFLDTYDLEKERGITIFSKQAILQLGETEVTLLDTPGHVDFSAEMERTLQVLDYAILVVNGADGVQGHTQTLWRLLARYEIPVFLFVNKMDQEGTDREALLEELKKRLNPNCVDFSPEQPLEQWMENLAVCDETVLECFLETEKVEEKQIVRMIRERKVFPCYFGSALKLTGVKEFLQGISRYTQNPVYGTEFGAKIYKISRDEQGNRLTHLKVTGGSLKVKDLLRGIKGTLGEDGEPDTWEEKADQIRLYSGARFEAVKEALAGTICAVTGLSSTYAGQGLGTEASAKPPFLEPVLTYEIILPEGCDVHTTLAKLRQLEEEEPQLHIVWNESLGEIHAQLMGEVQTEVLTRLILERFGIEVTFGSGSIVYKESIETAVEGVGHFEPLRHYAEVHLLIEPGAPGSGMQFDTVCSEDVLDRNWQRLILTHLKEKEHRGVLTGSPITDMKITLVTGKAHLKHTEGGDFRQATYRAVRQGLMKAKNVLLEPYYEFRLEVPTASVGRAMADIQKMCGTFQPPQMEGEMSILLGSAPAAQMRDYQSEVIAYTRGLGRLLCSLKGYEPCHDSRTVIDAIGYNADGDLENPSGSVFCTHGAGFVVPWDQVEDYMHLDSGLGLTGNIQTEKADDETEYEPVRGFGPSLADDKELEAIFERTYGPIKKEKQFSYTGSRSSSYGGSRTKTDSGDLRPRTRSKQESLEEYLLVDGYNIIFAWEDLNDLAQVSIDGARTKLMDILCNYQGFRKCHVILVFDAYKVEGNPGSSEKYHNIHVVYTKEAETADQYIEKTAHEIGRKYRVTVATSDRLEQVIILGQGCRRMSAKGLREEVELASREIRQVQSDRRRSEKNYLFHHLTDEMADYMEEIRLGKKESQDGEDQKG
ncbi:MAG: NYN domain-containing protein [Lachnospiraceae bacterium]